MSATTKVSVRRADLRPGDRLPHGGMLHSRGVVVSVAAHASPRLVRVVYRSDRGREHTVDLSAAAVIEVDRPQR